MDHKKFCSGTIGYVCHLPVKILMNFLSDTIQRESIISFPGFGISVNPPSSFTILGKTVYLYGVIIAAAFVLGMLYCGRRAKKIGISEDCVYDVLLWLLPCCILGARLYYVLFRLDYYLKNPAEIIAVWQGGLAIYGGVFAGAAVLFFFSKHRKISFKAMLDLFLTACILGQAIGRWGNFTNREAFGGITDIFCRMGLTDSSGKTVYVHPTFLYESLWDLTGFILMNRILTYKRRYNGECFYLYCFWYGSGRAWIEGLRTDSLYIPGTTVRISQIVSIAISVIGLILLIRNRNNHSLMNQEQQVQEQ